MINFEMNLAERMAFINDICLHPWKLMVYSQLMDKKENKSIKTETRLAIAVAAIEFHTNIYQSEQLVFDSDGVSIELPYMILALSKCLGLSATVENIATVLWSLSTSTSMLSGTITTSLMKRMPVGCDHVTEYMDIHAAVISPNGYFVSMVG